MANYYRTCTVRCPADDSDIEFSVEYIRIYAVKQRRPAYKIVVGYKECPNYNNCQLLDVRKRCPARVQVPNVP